MKALVQKDFYVIWKQMRIFVLVMVLLSMVNSAFNTVFLVVWCSMLPYTAMAYDERSHWNQLAAMMPYSKKDIVLSKYVLGWLCAGAASAVVLAHNHPSGIALPSEDDWAVTNRVKAALASIDVRLEDHIVVADHDFVSFSESGYLL